MPHSDKHKRYLSMKKRMLTTGDKLGRAIDKNIVETVVYLNLLDIPTSASCEGHLDHGVAAPWIDFAPRPCRELTELQKRAEVELQRMLLVRNTGKVSRKLEELQDQYTDTLDEISELLLVALKPVVVLLGEFYKEHECPYERMLVLRNNYQWARLSSLGEMFQDTRAESERKRELMYYQREMQEFTRFLRRTFEGN